MPLVAALLGGALPASASSSGQLNIEIDIRNIGSVRDLTAVPGTSTGTINLSWTEPYHQGGTAPYSYDVRVSSMAQIADDASFTVASPLSSVSLSVPPAPGSGGGAAGFLVDGLTQGVTYYFAIREKDSGAKQGVWLRDLLKGWNADNFAVATSTKPDAPAGGIVSQVYLSSITATWAVSASATDYVLIASLNAGFTSIAASSTTASSTGTVSGLGPNATYYLAVAACNFGCSGYTALGSTITLAAPAVSLATTSLNSTALTLSWDGNGNPAGTRYLIQVSLDGIVFTTANSVVGTAGGVSGLSVGTAYYLQVVALNGSGIQSAPSNVVSVVTPIGPVPSAPTGFSATAGLLSAALRWDAQALPDQGSGLLFYRILRSLSPSSGFVSIATTTATSYQDKPLTAGVAYYYRLLSHDILGVEGPTAASASATPYTLLPMEPIGVKVVPSASTVNISWSPTSRFFEGTPFVSTGAPGGDELIGYSVYRSTDICDPAYVHVSSLPINTTTITDNTGGLNYFYRLFSYNSLGVSTNAVTLSSLGERNYFLDDCQTTLVMDDATAETLNAAHNGLGDIRIHRSRRPQDVGDGVFQAAEWRAELNGATEIKGFVLPKPARFVLHFDVQNGKPVPTTTTVNGLSPLAGRVMTSAGSVNDLGVFWYNGAEYKKMYGRVDALSQTVSVDSPNLGVYQLRAQARSAGAVFDLSNLSGRVITPNGDGLNDIVIFSYDPGPRSVQPSGRIFDVNGAAVADMTPGLVPNTLTWDGRMSGRAAASGVYVYRITGDGKTFTGTIVVAR